MLRMRGFYRLNKFLITTLCLLLFIPSIIFPISSIPLNKEASAVTDTVPPVVNLTSPIGGTVNGTVDFSVYASDDTSVSKVEYYIDNIKVHESNVAPYVYNWDTSIYSNASHDLIAKAIDLAGNIGTSSTVSVTVYNQPPIPAPSNLTYTTDQYKTTLTWIDNSASEEGFKIERKEGLGGTWQQISTVGTNVVTFADESVVKPGTDYYYRVAAYSTGLSSGVSAEIKVTTPGTLIRSLQPDEATAQDTFFRDGRDTNYGTWDTLYTGIDEIYYQNYRTLLNPPQLDGIQPSQITKATVTLVQTGGVVGTPDFKVYKVTSAWSENSVMSSNAPSIDTANLVSSYTGMTNYEFDFTGYAKNPSGYGIEIVKPTDRKMFFASSSYSDVSKRPKYTYTYSNIPTAPTNLAVSLSQNNILIWTDNSDNEDGFKIERKTGASGVWQEIASVGANVTSYQDTASLSAEQEYFYRVKAYSTAGDSSYSNEAAITTPTVDIVAPNVALSTPSDWVKGTTVLSAYASDNSGIANVNFYVDNLLAGTVNNSPYNLNWNTTSVSDGDHTVYAVAYDTAGNNSTSNTANLRVDNTAPVIEISTPTNNASVSGAVYVNVSASDIIGVVKTELYVDDVLSGTSLVNPAGFSWDSTTVANGSHTLTVKSYDAANNTGVSSVTLSVSNVNLTAPSNVTVTADQYKTTLTWTDNSTNEEGFKIERKEGTGGTWQQIGTVGTNGVTYADESVVKPGTDYYYRVATYATGLSSGVSAEIKVTTPGTLTRSLQPDESAAQDTYIFEGNDLQNNGNNVRLYTGYNGVYMAHFWMLLNPPTPEGINPNQITNATLTLTKESGSGTRTFTGYKITSNWSESDATGVHFPTFDRSKKIFEYTGPMLATHDIDFTSYAQNPNGVGIAIEDLTSGNVSFFSSNNTTGRPKYTYTYGNTPAAPTNLAVTLNQNNILTWTDNSDNEDGFKVERKTGALGIWQEIASVGANVASYQDTASLSPGQEYFYRVKAYSPAGDSLYSNEAVITTPTVDIVAPNVVLNNAATTIRGITALSASATDSSGVTKVVFNVDNTAIGEASSLPYTVNWNTATVTDGEHTVVAVAYDSAGNKGISNIVTMRVDNTSPDVGIIAPLNGNTVSANVYIDITANDASGITKSEFYLDNILIGTDTTAPYNFIWDSTVSTNGNHVITIKGYDTVGNVGESSITINVANTDLPSPTNVIVAADQYKTTLNWTDNSTNEEGFKIERKEGSGGIWTQIGTVGVNVTTYIDESVVKPSANYYYRVVSFSTGRTPGVSGEVWLTTPGSLTRSIQPGEPEANDTYIFENNNLQNNGNNSSLATGYNPLYMAHFWILLNPPAPEGINPNQITNATLTLTKESGSGTRTFTGYKITSNWSESDATGVNFPTFDKSNKIFEYTGPMLATHDFDFTSYAKNPNSFGIAIEDITSGTVSFFSSNNTTGRPKFTYTYSNRPVMPTNLAAVTGQNVNLSWTDNSDNEDGFKIERKTGSLGSWEEAATVGPNVTTYQEKASLAAGQEYFYRIKSFNKDGNSDYSNEVSITPSPKNVTVELIQQPWNGMDTTVYSGQTSSDTANPALYNKSFFVASGTANYAYEKFDLSNIPKSKIVSAQLKLHLEGVSTSQSLEAYYLTREWMEEQATYIYSKAGVPWTTPGGDHSGSPIASFKPTTTGDQWITLDLTKAVDDWVNGKMPNFGIFYRSNDCFSISSSENPDETLRPRLIVTYQLIEIPPVVSLVSPVSNQQLTGQTDLSVNVDSEVVRVDFYVDDVLVGSAGKKGTDGLYHYSWNSTNVSNGKHKFYAKAYNSSGNVGISGVQALYLSDFSLLNASGQPTTVQNGDGLIPPKSIDPVKTTATYNPNSQSYGLANNQITYNITGATASSTRTSYDYFLWRASHPLADPSGFWKSEKHVAPTDKTEDLENEIPTPINLSYIQITPRNPGDKLRANIKIWYNYQTVLNKTVDLVNADNLISLDNVLAKHIDVNFTNLSRDDVTGGYHAEIAQIRVFKQDSYAYLGSTMYSGPLGFYWPDQYKKLDGCIYTDGYITTTGNYVVPVEVKTDINTGSTYLLGESNIQHIDNSNTVWVKSTQRMPDGSWYFDGSVTVKEYKMAYASPYENEWRNDWNASGGYQEPSWDISNTVNNSGSWISAGKLNSTDSESVEYTLNGNSDVNSIYIKPRFNGLQAKVYSVNLDGTTTLLLNIDRLEDKTYYLSGTYNLNKVRIEFTNLQRLTSGWFPTDYKYIAGLDKVAFMKTTSGTQGDLYSNPISLVKSLSQFQFKAKYSAPQGSSINFYYSTDGQESSFGANPVNSGEMVTLSQPTSTLYLKASFQNSNPDSSPELKSWTLVSTGIPLEFSTSNKINSASPKVEIVSPFNRTTVSGQVYVNAAVYDDDPIKWVDFYVDNELRYRTGSQPYQFVWNTVYEAEGLHTIRVQATDSYDNMGTSIEGQYFSVFADTLETNNMIDTASTKNITLANGKATLPTTPTNTGEINGYIFSKAIDAEPGKVITKAKLTVNNNISPGTNIYYFLSTGGGSFEPITPGQDIVLNKPGSKLFLQAQLNTLNSTVTPELLDWQLDYVQNDQLSVNVVSQANKPFVALTVAGDVYHLSGNVNLTATAQNPADVSRVEFLVDGKLIGSDTTNPYSATFDSSRLSDGSHVLSTRAFNLKGEFITGSLDTVTGVVYNTGVPQGMLGLEDYWSYSEVNLGNSSGYINVANGNLYLTEDDLMLPSTRFAVIGSRSYNSMAKWDSPYGYGWSINSEYSLAFRANGDLILNEGDGGQNFFTKNTDGAYTAPPGTFMTVSREGDNYIIERDDRVKYVFNADGKLLTITEPNGNSINYAYNDLGLLDTVTGNQGRWIKYNYLNGKLASISDSAGRKVSYIYDDLGNLEQYKDSAGNYITYEYDNNHKLIGVVNGKGKRDKIIYTNDKVTAITDALGNTFNVSYDETAKTTTFTNPKNGSFKYSYNSSGNVTQLDSTDETGKNFTEQFTIENNMVTSTRNPRGYWTYLKYNTKGKLTEVKDNGSKVLLSNQYDSSGYNLLQSTDAKGNTTYFNYDPQGNLIRSWALTYSYNTVGNVVYSTVYKNFGYDTVGNMVYSDDGRGNKTLYAYIDGNLQKITDAGGNSASFTYDSAGNITSATDARNLVTWYSYDNLGRLTKVTFPDGTTNEFIFDANSNLLTARDNNGNFTRYAYDDLDRVTSATDAENNRTEYGYDALSNQVWVRDANLVAAGNQGHTKEWIYNGLSQLNQVKDILGNTVNYGYDENGNITTIQDHLLNTQTALYDEYDRLVKYTYPIDTVNGVKRYGNISYGYDPVGNKISQTDALGNIAKYSYNPLGLMISGTDPLNNTTYFGYDSAGNRTVIRDAKGNSTQYTYDVVNRLEKILYPTDQYNPVQNILTFGYDQSGNKVKRVDQKGQITQYKYDSRNRLSDIIYPDGKSVQYQYDGNGNRLLMTDSTGVTSYFYDNIGRLTSTANPYRKNVAYSYDKVGNRLSMTITDEYNQSQRTINYSYDSLNRLSTVTAPGNKVNTLTYGSNLLLKEILYANGTKTSYLYNDADWLTQIATVNGKNETVSKFDYTYDSAGNKLTMKDTLGVVSNYQYYQDGSLKSVAKEGKTTEYFYDAVGNRSKMVNSLGTSNYTYDVQNKLRTIIETDTANPPVTKTTTYGYDNNGNQITESGPNGTTYFYYDAENRLNRIKYPNSQIPDTTSTYNGDGLRVRMNDDLNNTYYLYDGANVIADTDGTGVIKSYYLRGPSGNLFSTENAGKFYYYATDGLGSVTGITDESGAKKNQYSYDEFGNIRFDNENDPTSIKNPFKFTGAIYDKTANLYLMGARFYNPKVGRFITQDSFGADFGADWTDHLYTYTSNNPVNMIDPTGHEEYEYQTTPEYKIEITGGPDAEMYYRAARQEEHYAKTPKAKKEAKKKQKVIEKEADAKIAADKAKKSAKKQTPKYNPYIQPCHTTTSTPVRPTGSLNAKAGYWQGGVQEVLFAENHEIAIYGYAGRTHGIQSNVNASGGVVKGLTRPEDFVGGYIGLSGSYGGAQISVQYSGKNPKGEKIVSVQGGPAAGAGGSFDAGYTKLLGKLSIDYLAASLTPAPNFIR